MKKILFFYALIGFTGKNKKSIIKNGKKNAEKQKKGRSYRIKGGISMKKRFASIALSLAMCLTLLPTAAYAEDVSEGGGI